MATDKNFVVKNGLEVGGQLIVTSSGQLAVAAVSSQLQFLDNVKAKFGNGSDLQIWHESSTSNSYITEGGSGNLYISGNNLRLTNYGITESYLQADANGAVTLYYDGSSKLATTSSGINVTGTISSGAITSSGDIKTEKDIWVNYNASGNEYLHLNYATGGDGGILFRHANTLKWQQTALTGSGQPMNWYSYDASDSVMTLSSAGLLTTDSGYQVNGTTVIDSSRNLTNIGTISSGAITSSGRIKTTNGLFQADEDSQKFRQYHIETFDAGGSFLLGKIENNSSTDGGVEGVVRFAYDFGSTTNNCAIHFNFAQRSGTARGTWWYEHDDQDGAADRVHVRLIDDGAGNMYVWVTCADYAETFIEANWRHGASIEDSGTLSSGTLTTGTTLFDTANDPTSEHHIGKLFAHDNVYIPDSNYLLIGDGEDLQLQHNGSHSYIRSNTGDLYIRNNADDKDIIIQTDNGSGGTTNYMLFDGSNERIVISKSVTHSDNVRARFGGSNDLQIYHDSVNSASRIENTQVGDIVITNKVDDGDVIFQSDDGSGGTATYFKLDGGNTYTSVSKNFLFQDNVRADFGNSSDLRIQHTGSAGYVANYTGSLVLQNNTDDGDVVIQSDNGSGSVATYFMADGSSGSANLYHYGTLKLNTKSAGVDITGELQATSFSDGTISGITFIDEDSFATNSATRVPTQQSIKAYVDAQVSGVVDSAPSALNTLNELAAALGDDANFSTTTSTALGNRLRVDTASQGLTGTQQANAITNLGITATKAELNYVDGVTSNIQTQLDGKQASGSYLTGNQTITLSGDVSGSGTTSIAVTIADDSHNHIISNVDGLQTALDAKLPLSGGTMTGLLKVSMAQSAGSPILDLHNSTNGNGVKIRFTDVAAGTSQFGHIEYLHQDSKSYGSAASFTLGTSESTTTILADGKLMYGEGIYSKPSSGTGAGTRKDSNWDTAYGWGNHASAGYLTGNQTITLSGDVSGSGTTSINVTVADDSHNHIISNIDGLADAFDHSYISAESATNLAVGWYTIATNVGDRATARFGIWDTDSGDHQAVTFYAAHHFGTDQSNTITVLDNSRFSGSPFRYIRIKDAGTYDGAVLQVYIDKADNAVNAAILGDNFQSVSWVLRDWIPDATTPPTVSNYSNFAERAKVDLDNIDQGGLATTGEIYAGGDTTQYRVFHDSYHPNADTLTTARTIAGTSFNGSANIDISYNNLTNTPTIPTNNNQLTNGAGYITSTNSAITSKLPLAGGTMSGSIAMANYNITGVNQLEFNDPGEGIVFKQGSSGDMVLKIIDDASDNILQYSGTSAVFDVVGNITTDGLTSSGSVYVGSPTTNGGVINLIQSGSNPEIRIQGGEGGASLFSIYNTATSPDAEQFFINNTLGSSHLGNKRGALKLESSSGVVLTLGGTTATFAGNVDVGSGIDVTGNITVTGTVDGRDVATDGSKLDGISSGADVTPSWVPSSDPNYLTSVPNHSAALITSGTLSNSRLPTDLGSTRTLSGSVAVLKLQETDVTNSPTWWHVADGGNYSIRLNNSGTYPISINTNGTNNAVSTIVMGYNTDFSNGIDVTNNITVTGTVDGRDVATDGTKLDTIATNADVTPSWVPSSDPGYLTSSSTQSKYIRSDANDDFSGTLNYTPDTGTILALDGGAAIQRHTANGALSIGKDDALILGAGEAINALRSNITMANEFVYIGAEGGVTMYAFPNNDTTWSNRKTFSFDGANGLNMESVFTVDINGNLSATTKSFDIEHPTKEGMRLHHGVLEGPEHAVYIRGKSNSYIIELPDYWEGLVHEDTITVQLTPIGGQNDMWIENIEDNKVYINCEREMKQYFYYIQAERKDIERFEVEYEV